MFIPEVSVLTNPTNPTALNHEILENYTPNECNWGSLVLSENNNKHEDVAHEKFFDIYEEVGEVAHAKKVKTTLEMSGEDVKPHLKRQGNI